MRLGMGLILFVILWFSVNGLVSAVAQSRTLSKELMLNHSNACVATPAVPVTTCSEKLALISRDGVMTDYYPLPF